jgi:hypothetical protein
MASKRRFGALRKLPSGRWQARYRTPEGVLVTAGKTFATKTDAGRFLDAIELDQLRGVWHDPAPSQNETVRGWCRRWLKQHSPSLTPSLRRRTTGCSRGACCTASWTADRSGWPSCPWQPCHPCGWGSGWRTCSAAACSASRIRKAYRVLSLAMERSRSRATAAEQPVRQAPPPPAPA